MQRMRDSASDAAALPALSDLAAEQERALSRLERVTVTLLAAASQTEPARALANASAYLDLFSRTVLGWLWLRQASVARNALGETSRTHTVADDDFYRGKVQAARYWFGWELPRTEQLAALLERGDAIPFDMRDAWF